VDCGPGVWECAAPKKKSNANAMVKFRRGKLFIIGFLKAE
jgi:hypothetical protein